MHSLTKCRLIKAMMVHLKMVPFSSPAYFNSGKVLVVKAVVINSDAVCYNIMLICRWFGVSQNRRDKSCVRFG